MTASTSAASATSASTTASTEGTATDGTDATTVGTMGTTPDPTTGETSGSTGSEGTGTDSDTEGSSSTGAVVPFECDDPANPVQVVGGGAYPTVHEGVFATPPGGTVQICPGTYQEAEAIQIAHDMTIQGAGSSLVTIQSSADYVAAQAAGGAFEVVNADITFEGFSLEGGRYGIYLYWTNTATDELAVIRDVHVSDSITAGLYLYHFALDAADYGVVTVQIEDVVVENIDHEAVPEAAVSIRAIDAEFVDTTIRNNVTEYGALYIDESHVTYTGGAVYSNEATDVGGGAKLDGAGNGPAIAEPTLDVVASDWGAGAAFENQPADVHCSNSSVSGWLGTPVDAHCEYGNPCCVPT
jgi:hypothetical protein